jgi:hypothetical protein
LPGLTRQSIRFAKKLFAKKMDARDRRQVYAVCASLTALAGHDVDRASIMTTIE